jgi:hypothetical protein
MNIRIRERRQLAHDPSPAVAQKRHPLGQIVDRHRLF